MRWHDIRWDEYAAADDRELAACLVQQMIVSVWNAFFEDDPRTRHLDGDPDGDADEAFARERGDYDVDPVDHQNPPVDPLALSNPQLVNYVKEYAQDYDWHNPCDTDCDIYNITFPEVPGGAVLERRGYQWVNGRGSVNTSDAYPSHYAEAVRW